MNKIIRFFETVRHLKIVQLCNRFKRKLVTVKKNNHIVRTRSPIFKFERYALLPSCLNSRGELIFLNVGSERGCLDWNDPTKSKLWLYNLHYFDILNSKYEEECIAFKENLILSWIEDNSFMHGNGWEPYPLSLRTVNWIKWFHSKQEMNPVLLDSLADQVDALYQQLEYHLLGNHLFANAKALIFAGCYFEGQAATRWLNKGLEILDKETAVQILKDGANFELSPMYHHIILTDLLDLINLANSYSLKELKCRSVGWEKTVQKMMNFARCMSHPDGSVSFFNDSAFGIAPTYKDLWQYASLLGIQGIQAQNVVQSKDLNLNHFKEAGYIILETDTVKAILDVAKVGPDYLPGHAHADTLSFELSIGSQRVFVNSGTSVYGLGDERLRQRKTEAHNTVVVDGEDSSEVWSGFRVARRAYPSIPKINAKEQTVSVECSHDGYMRLPGKVMHTRNWQMSSESLVVSDSLTGTFNEAQAHYHLHPDIQVLNEDRIIIKLPDNSKYGVRVEGGEAVVLDSTWHPEFGLSIANKKLLINFEQNEVTFVLERIM